MLLQNASVDRLQAALAENFRASSPSPPGPGRDKLSFRVNSYSAMNINTKEAKIKYVLIWIIQNYSMRNYHLIFILRII